MIESQEILSKIIQIMVYLCGTLVVGLLDVFLSNFSW
jgi:hypothetical protein